MTGKTLPSVYHSRTNSRESPILFDTEGYIKTLQTKLHIKNQENFYIKQISSTVPRPQKFQNNKTCGGTNRNN